MINVYGLEIPQNPYYENPTMRMLGKNCYVGPLNQESFAQLDEILKARHYSCTRDTAMDIFMLGYIHGKRAERAKRKAGV